MLTQQLLRQMEEQVKVRVQRALEEQQQHSTAMETGSQQSWTFWDASQNVMENPSMANFEEDMQNYDWRLEPTEGEEVAGLEPDMDQDLF